jgi:anti-sigma B factor antagonist
MTAPAFKIEVGAVPGLPDGALVSFNGPIDAKNITVFKAQMDALQGRAYRQFLLQMGEVRYINSTGLAYLTTMAELIEAAGGALVLFNVQPKVKVILETMGLVQRLRVYPSKAAAIRDLKSSASRKAGPAPSPTPAPARPPGVIRRLFRKFFGPPEDRSV